MVESGLPLADELAQLSVRTSPMLLSVDTVTEAVEVLTSLAEDMMIEASGAGVSLLDDSGRRTSTASTSPLVTEADDWQYQLDEGPCLTAWAAQVTIRIDDLNGDPRWPRWSAAVSGLPLRSVLSAPMVAGQRCLGAVKVYSADRSAFDSRSEHKLNGFASTAALLLANMDTLDNARRISDELRTAVLARDIIQLATGVIMGRDHIPRDAAWQQLVHTAKTSGRSTATVAADLLSAAGSPS